jgi:hypothetical protein
MLEVMRSLWPPMPNGSLSSLRILAASSPTTRIGHLSRQDGELIAPEPRHEVVGPHGTLEALHHLLEQKVPMAYPSVSFTSLKSSMSR